MDVLDVIQYLETTNNCFNISINESIIFTFISSLCIQILSYPIQPNSIMKKKMYSYLMDLPLFIPNQKISKYIEYYIETNPISPYLDTKKSLMNWCYSFCKGLMYYSMIEVFGHTKNSIDSLHSLHYYDFWNNMLIQYYSEQNNTIIQNNMKQNIHKNIVELVVGSNKNQSMHINDETNVNRLHLYIEYIKKTILHILFHKKYKNQFAILFLTFFLFIILYIMYIQYKNED